jgi:histone H3/H4|tara:strand:- start:323 stop:766 length:444 start_codon:yes stop_codon:yes gene_type:complete
MIEKDAFTIINNKTYQCVKIENGFAYLRNILSDRGKFLKLRVEQVPYLDENNKLIKPPKEKINRFRSTLNFKKMLCQETDLKISRDALVLMKEWLETSLADMIAYAEENALSRGDNTITAAHVYWWELSENQDTTGYWPEQIDYVRR